MRRFSQKDTICAVATPPGSGGLGVVRISGPEAKGILSRLWRGRKPVSNFRPRTLYFGDIIILSSDSPSGRTDGSILSDRVLAVFMPGPNTYTGDDVVELSCHGSQFLLERITGSIVSCGARHAEPGEFTRRAFLSGRMDLAQAEGVADLIAATGERAARLAAEQLSGRLSREIYALGKEIAAVRAEVEAAIDFPEEHIDLPGTSAVSDKIFRVKDRTDALRLTFREGRLARKGVRVAIAGMPNAGKSSIMNRLSGTDRAIVHSSPGTTRDVVEEAISIGGILFLLRDTAGLRAEACEVEALGIKRTRESIASADLVLAIVDGSRPFEPQGEEILSKLDPEKTIVVINKSDLPRAFGPKDPLETRRFATFLSTSAKRGDGIEALRKEMFRRCCSDPVTQEDVTVTSSRHKALLDETNAALSRALSSLEKGEPTEFCAHHLAGAQNSLGGITGEVTTDEILNDIFSRFCIGK
ncbi:MAG TPA: tRNA uridine-5-carboxymethylaminomethyl(34) synthesis GTPase MnmE [bacterium]|nr:tRNA uridine-5-carboxymethylaminomethyl(34) synthesis GTPase MnmE [bacterium]